MAGVEWTMKGPSFNNCNCAPGCPCQFNSLPTHGNCCAVTAMEIEQGQFGDVSLDGLRWVCIYDWPGAVHEGNGSEVSIIDERADDRQRDALTRILRGEESEDGATYLAVFATTMTRILDPIFRPIELDIDIDKRTARVRVEGLVDSVGEPIVNPITGEQHRALIMLPNGFEYTQAEVARGTTNVLGDLSFHLTNSHAHFVDSHLSNAGVVHA